jgi:hypothetical protein
MLKTIKELKQERPDLVELFESMDREQLLKQCYKEALDAINMESRVALFMEELETGLSNTTYTLDSLRMIVNTAIGNQINNYILTVLEDTDGMSAEEIIEYMKGDLTV